MDAHTYTHAPISLLTATVNPLKKWAEMLLRDTAVQHICTVVADPPSAQLHLTNMFFQQPPEFSLVCVYMFVSYILFKPWIKSLRHLLQTGGGPRYRARCLNPLCQVIFCKSGWGMWKPVCLYKHWQFTFCSGFVERGFITVHDLDPLLFFLSPLPVFMHFVHHIWLLVPSSISSLFTDKTLYGGQILLQKKFIHQAIETLSRFLLR